MGIIFLDMGRSDVKGLRLHYNESRNETWSEHSTPTLLAEVSKGELKQRVRSGAGWPDGWYIVNGEAYAFGQAATRQTPMQPESANRYVKGYAGVITAIMCYQMFEAKSDNQVTVGTMFPPADYVHSQKLLTAVKGKWRVEGKAGKAEYMVDKSLAIDEPLGGLMASVLTADGRVAANHLFNQGDIEAAVVIDIGGYTIDLYAVDVDNGIPKPDPSSANSYRGNSAMYYIMQFERDLRLNYADDLIGVGELPRRTLESALRTGYLRFGNQTVDVTPSRNGILNTFALEVENRITMHGGIGQYNMIVLTGGGAGLLYQTMAKREALARIDVRPIWQNLDNIALANVYGLSRLYLSRRGA